MKGIPELFKNALNTLNEKEDNSEITKKYINKKADEIINLNKKELTSFQNVVLSKIMLNLISFCNKRNPSEKLEKLQKYFKNKYESNIGKDIIFNDIKKEDNKSLEDIILIILTYFLKKLRETQNYKDLKEKWDGFELNLEDFEINNNMKNELCSYLEKEIEVNKCEVLENVLKHLKSENSSKIIKYIYDHYICANEGYKYMKPLGDKERANKEHSTEIKLDMEENIPENYLINVFEKWVIKINLSDKCITPFILFGKDEITDNYSENCYKKIKNSTKKEKYDKKFEKYIEFKNKVIKFIEDEKKNIRLKITIELEITPVKDNDQIYAGEDFYNFVNIECISSYKNEGKEYKYKDKDILKYGINGKSPGFIFLINELCNDDYSK